MSGEQIMNDVQGSASEASSPSRPLTTAQKLAFGFPSLPHALVAYPVYSLLPAYYAANTSVTLAQIGAIAAASRIFDAVNDPIIGYLSDRTRTRWGSRKPWFILAIFFLAGGIIPLFNPPPEATIVYFAIWSTVLYTGFTMFEVPRSAWMTEATRDYMERSRIGTMVGWFNICGSLVVYLLPIGMSFFTGSSAIGPDTMKGIVFLYLIIMPLGMISAVMIVPKGVVVARQKVDIRGIWRTITSCKPLMRFYIITILWGLGQGSFIGVSFLFQTEYMGFKEEIPYIMITFFASGVMFMPIWSKILITADRHRVWGSFVLLSTAMGFITLLLPRGPEAFIPVVLLAVVRGFFGTPQNFLPGAVLSDVIDYDTMKTGSSKAGNLFAVQMLLIKISMALSGALAFFILDISGFRIGQPATPMGDLGLIAAYLGFPFLMHLTMAALCWNFPINRKRHRIIQKSLERRALRAKRDELAAAATAG
jgi:Na+/melibiose symporter-like transporter